MDRSASLDIEALKVSCWCGAVFRTQLVRVVCVCVRGSMLVIQCGGGVLGFVRGVHFNSPPSSCGHRTLKAYLPLSVDFQRTVWSVHLISIHIFFQLQLYAFLHRNESFPVKPLPLSPLQAFSLHIRASLFNRMHCCWFHLSVQWNVRTDWSNFLTSFAYWPMFMSARRGDKRQMKSCSGIPKRRVCVSAPLAVDSSRIQSAGEQLYGDLLLVILVWCCYFSRAIGMRTRTHQLNTSAQHICQQRKSNVRRHVYWTDVRCQNTCFCNKICLLLYSSCCFGDHFYTCRVYLFIKRTLLKSTMTTDLTAWVVFWNLQ